MPRSTQDLNPRPAIRGYLADLAGAAQRQDASDLYIMPEFHLRMVAWSLSLSSVLWCFMIVAGHELWKAWR